MNGVNSASVEREAKLEVPASFVVPDLSRMDGIEAVPVDTVTLDATYWDTEALDLVRRGASLRHRREPKGSVWTLKLADPDPPDDDGSATSEPRGWIRRRELEVRSPVEVIPSGLADIVTPWVRDRPLVAVVRFSTERHRFRLFRPSGDLVAEVTDDRVTVEGGVAAAPPDRRFRELEVEAGPAASETDLARIVDVLAAAGARRGTSRSKVARALGPPAQVPVDLPGAVPDPDAGPVVLVSAALRIRVAALIDADVWVRAEQWAEESPNLTSAVTAMLRAERAVRAQLRAARPLLDRLVSDAARRQLRRLAAPLMRAHEAARWAEVLAEGSQALDPEDRDRVQPLLREARTEADRAIRRLSARLTSPAHRDLLVALFDLATDPPMGVDPLGGPLPPPGSVAAQAWRRLDRSVRRMGVDEREEGTRWIEDLRPVVRRAWAAALVAAPADPEAADRSARLEPLVAYLDDLRDARRAQDQIRSAALGAPRDQVLALGQLLGWARERTRRRLDEWPERWLRTVGTTGRSDDQHSP